MANPNLTEAAAAAATTEVRRTISPYDLTSANNPGAVISHPLLKGINYDEWACEMKTALSSRKKFASSTGQFQNRQKYHLTWRIGGRSKHSSCLG